MDVFISIVAVCIAFSCLATLLFSDIKDRYTRAAAANSDTQTGERPEKQG